MGDNKQRVDATDKGCLYLILLIFAFIVVSEAVQVAGEAFTAKWRTEAAIQEKALNRTIKCECICPHQEED